MNPILWQKQLMDNATDLNNFYKDLEVWGEDMKRKDESVQNSKVSNKLPYKKKFINESYSECKDKSNLNIGCTDYTAWDKFDAEAECEKIDYNENDESELSDECDELVRDKAYLEKEKGNKFVKEKKWDEAIICYTKAIQWYSYDAVFYANRALCFLKKENYIKAETDCTMSLKLDKTYVKAYLRRAAARVALYKLQEAKVDLLKILELEPHNEECKKMLGDLKTQNNKISKMTISQRPVSKFTKSRIAQTGAGNPSFYNSDESRGERESQELNSTQLEKDGHSDMGIIIVKAISKAVHLQSKQPLKQINIEEVMECDEVISRDNKSSFPKIDTVKKTFKIDDLKIFERNSEKMEVEGCEAVKENKNHINAVKTNEVHVELVAPNNSVQFYSQWRHLKTVDNKYYYLKLIKPEDLPFLFKESFESSIFSEMLEVLVKFYIKNKDDVYNFLKCVTEVRRFSAITMFLSDNDKKYLWKLLNYIREHEEHSKDELDLLCKNFHL